MLKTIQKYKLKKNIAYLFESDFEKVKDIIRENQELHYQAMMITITIITIITVSPLSTAYYLSSEVIQHIDDYKVM